MTAPAATLREIHRLRRHAKNLQDEIDRLPRQLKAQQGKVSRSEEALREAQETVKRAKLDTHAKESELKEVQQLIAKHEKQRNEATTRKEYDTLNHEIAAEKQKCRAIEDKILESMLAADEKAAQVPELEKALQAAKEEVARFELTAGERRAGLEAQLRQAMAELKDIEVHLPDDIRREYERIVNSRGEDAMAAVHNRTCAACYTEITAQMSNELLAGRFVLCKNCGRLLYLPE